MKRKRKISTAPPFGGRRGRGNAAADEVRLRYLYRSLVLNGKVRLSLASARGLIGPDCAYHLYGVRGWQGKREKSG